MTTTEENLVQLEAVRKLAEGYRNCIEMSLLLAFGSDFRITIEEWKKEKGRIPNADELIWMAGVHIGHDPKNDVEEIIEKG